MSESQEPPKPSPKSSPEPNSEPEPAPESGDARRTVSDPAALKALAHPLRLRILRHLGIHGPATSTTLAAALGENTGTLSYHLRRLEQGGFIEDAPDRPGGRERWWQAVRGLDVRRPAQDEMTDGERAVASTLDRMRMEEDVELARRFMEELGPSTVVATGGLSSLIAPHSDTIEHVEPWLTLHGLRIVYERNVSS